LNASPHETVHEPARDIPVYSRCDVLVVGGGPAGTAAAIAAARMGADVVLVERYGHLGGLATGGLVCWIDRMTDWHGNLVVGGVGKEFMDLCDAEDGELIGPSPDQWGSHDPALVGFWGVRNTAHRGTVTWAPTVDPEVLKLISNDMVREAKVRMLFHSWVVAPVIEDGRVAGAIFESKEGRHAILASATIDCTGDGDVFALAGAAFETAFDNTSIHALMNTCCRVGNVDALRYFEFREKNPEQFASLMRQADEAGVSMRPGVMPRNDQVIVMTPKLSGYSAINVADQSEVEFISRDAHRRGVAWMRQHMPGFENAYLLETAPQIGVRHSRRLVGVKHVTFDHWRSSGTFDDVIGLCPGPTEHFPTLDIPLGCLVPQTLDGVIAAGRNLSCDPQSHNPLREVPECWVMGQGAGVAAAVAVSAGVHIRNANIQRVQAELRDQGAIIDRPLAVTSPIPTR
jgi:hypothetical protein